VSNMGELEETKEEKVCDVPAVRSTKKYSRKSSKRLLLCKKHSFTKKMSANEVVSPTAGHSNGKLPSFSSYQGLKL